MFQAERAGEKLAFLPLRLARPFTLGRVKDPGPLASQILIDWRTPCNADMAAELSPRYQFLDFARRAARARRREEGLGDATRVSSS